MRKIIFLISILLIVSACDKIDDVSFETNLSQQSSEIVVNDDVPRSKINYYPTYNAEFDLSLDNADTHDYLNKLKEIDLSNVQFSFEGLNALAGNTDPVDLTIIIDNETVLSLSDFSYDTVAQGDPIMLTDITKINMIANNLLQNKKLHVQILSSIPSLDLLRFYINFNVHAKITANVL